MKTRLATFFITTSIALFYSSLALAQPSQLPGPQPPPWDWPGHWHMGGGWGFWWMFPLLMLFFFFVCVALFFVVFRSWSGHHHWGPPWHMMDRSSGPWGDPTFSALQLLNERYAKGEIQKSEYEEKKAAILSRGQR